MVAGRGQLVFISRAVVWLYLCTYVLLCVTKLTIAFRTSANFPKNEFYAKKSELLKIYLTCKMTG